MVCFLIQRNELHKLGEDASEMFDLTETRRSILARRSGLQAECNGIELMQKRFTNVQAILKHGRGGGDEVDAPGGSDDAGAGEYQLEDEAAMVAPGLQGEREPLADDRASTTKSAESVSRPKF